jgi:lipopolysaccharide transport system ATP-binding protein
LRDSLTNWFRRPAATSGARIGQIWALQDITFDVGRGEALGVIGRNGAGKSTLLKLLSQITAPTRGVIDLYGRVGSLLEVGAGFHPELTGRENIYLNGAILGMRRAETQARFDEIVAFAEIEPFLDTAVKFYSSGMYMRLAFSVAAHLEPEILLIDEVLAVGDAAFQKKCLGKMDAVAHSGRTVLFVSHNLNAVETLCSRCLWLDAGRLIEDSQDVRGVIRSYLERVDGGAAQNEWVNVDNRYANPYFRPLRFAFTDRNGSALEFPVRNDADLWVQIEGEIERIDPALTVGYALFDEENRLLYWSYHTDLGEFPLQAGRTCLRGRIPARLLNEGAYRLELIASLHFRQWLLQPEVNAPTIWLTIQGGLSDSPFWVMKRPGILAPALEWVRVE